ncbi:MAG: helix-turn-helix transcriptional regulator [Ktedonobacteraceae bacterium]|nr:helix-turn-helix transcriptional regulator [Ktedonobacteraceae bacterium]
MPTPKPGKPVRGSQTGRPIMALLDLLGRRWTLRILWELREKKLGFRALQNESDTMSPSVLSQRLMELREAGIVEQNEDADYLLTQEGNALVQSLAPLNDWAMRWAERDLPSYTSDDRSSTSVRR